MSEASDPKDAARREPRAARSSPGEATRDRILDAALKALKVEGFQGTTARSIARIGGFNQALVFYHFGSVDEVLLSTVDRMGERRLITYRERLAGAADLPGLLGVARGVLVEDVEQGAMTVLSQLVAAAHGRPEFGRRLSACFDPWIGLVNEAVQRVVAGTPLEGLLPSRDVALALTGMFVGVELLSQLDPQSGHAESLLATIDATAGLLQGFLGLLGPAIDGDVAPS